jgi:hypothetical protein
MTAAQSTAAQSTAGDTGPGRERRVVDLVCRVPSCFREYAQTAQTARDVHRIPADLLARLVAHGLPHVGAAGDALFDKLDLINVSAGLGLRSAWYFGQRGWTAALGRLAAGGPAAFEIEVRPRCPYPGHQGDCDFELWLAGGEPEPGTSECAVGTMTGPGTLMVRTGQGSRTAPAEIARVLEIVAGAAYLDLPAELERDLGFFDRAQVANCSLAAAAVAREASRRGVQARRSFGLVLLAPYAGLHNWVEFLVDGCWSAFDPHLIGYLEAAGVLRPGWWPRLNSIGGLLLRLAASGASTSLATHRGVHADVSFPMRSTR